MRKKGTAAIAGDGNETTQKPSRVPRFAECPNWVKSAVLEVGRSLPVYPDNRTSLVSAATSQKCQAQEVQGGYDSKPTRERVNAETTLVVN